MVKVGSCVGKCQVYLQMNVFIDIWLFIELFDKVILKDTHFKCTETIKYFDIVISNASSNPSWAGC